MKKFLCMVIAVVMVLSMGVVAFAEENNASIEVGLDGMTFEKGSAIEFTVTIYKNSSGAPAFAFDLYFGGDVVPSKLEIQREGTWEPVAVGEGGKYVVEGIKFSGDEYSVQLRATFNESGEGNYRGSLLEATALVNSVPSEYTKIVDGFYGSYTVVEPIPVPPSISTDLDGMTFEKGVAKEFTVTIHRGDSQAYSFAYELRFGEDLVPAKLEYYGEGGWEPATNKKAKLDGNALRGKDLTFANSNNDEYTLRFRATFDKTGEASLWAWVESTYGSEYSKVSNSDIDGSYRVIGSFNPTFNPAPAEDPVIVDLDGADEAEEANPNTGALVLVPAVVALAAVTGIMVSKRK